MDRINESLYFRKWKKVIIGGESKEIRPRSLERSVDMFMWNCMYIHKCPTPLSCFSASTHSVNSLVVIAVEAVGSFIILGKLCFWRQSFPRLSREVILSIYSKYIQYTLNWLLCSVSYCRKDPESFLKMNY